MDGRKFDEYGGFSIVKIVLSDALPAAAFHPDFEKEVEEKKQREKDKRMETL